MIRRNQNWEIGSKVNMEKPNFSDLLNSAIKEPGKMLEAYRAFHRYSTGNQMLILTQCYARGIQPGPIATFKQWQEKKRSVKKGEKALQMYLPVTVHKKDENGEKTEECFQLFKCVPRWFVLSQTEGESVEAEPIPGWDKQKALDTLGIQEIPFDITNGNTQGYAMGKSIAINPLAQLPQKTTFHELAHIVLGHLDTEAMAAHGEFLPRNLMEVEAESVAMLCLASLDLPGVEYCRGYIQSWADKEGIPEKSARKIMGAADKILKAGQV